MKVRPSTSLLPVSRGIRVVIRKKLPNRLSKCLSLQVSLIWPSSQTHDTYLKRFSRKSWVFSRFISFFSHTLGNLRAFCLPKVVKYILAKNAHVATCLLTSCNRLVIDKPISGCVCMACGSLLRASPFQVASLQITSAPTLILTDLLQLDGSCYKLVKLTTCLWRFWPVKRRVNFNEPHYYHWWRS